MNWVLSTLKLMIVRRSCEQAISKTTKLMQNVRMEEERRLVQELMRELACDSMKVCVGVQETMALLPTGAVRTVLLGPQDDVKAVVACLVPRGRGAHEAGRGNGAAAQNGKPDSKAESTPSAASSTVKPNGTSYSMADSDLQSKARFCSDHKQQMLAVQALELIAPPDGSLVVELVPFAQWMEDTCRSFGAELQRISGVGSAEAVQFCQGLAGVAGLLRYVLDPSTYLTAEPADDEAGTHDGSQGSDEEPF